MLESPKERIDNIGGVIVGPKKTPVVKLRGTCIIGKFTIELYHLKATGYILYLNKNLVIKM